MSSHKPTRLIAALVVGVAWIVSSLTGGVAAEPDQVAPGVLLLGRIDSSKIKECSGVVRSTRDTAVFWVHNDGARPKLFGITRAGDKVAEIPVLGAVIEDWEDLASDGRGNLFIGDIGNNDAARQQIAVHQIPEPSPADSGTPVKVTRSWKLNYPDQPFDSEALFVWKDHAFLISKVFNDAKAGLYRFSLGAESPVTLEFVTELDISTPVTGAALSPSGNRLAVVGQSGAFVMKIKGDPGAAGHAKQDRTRFKDRRVEGCCFVEDGLLAVSETSDVFLFTGKPFLPK